MAGTSVGLDIGTSAVRAAELSFGRQGITLERFGEVALPPGAVRDGEVMDVATVTEAIKRLWSATKFSTKKVIVGVANQKVIVRQADLPWMPIAELKQSLAFQVQDLIPIPFEQAILDVHPVEEFTADGGARTLRVLLVAAARDMVLKSIEATKAAGLTVEQVDLTPFAVMRSIATVDTTGLASGQSGAEALVDIGGKVTNIVVHHNGVPRFVRILLMGGNNLTEAVAERLGVPWEQAESVKQEFGLRTAPAPVDGNEHPAVRVIEASASTLVDEIRGSLDYYLAQSGSTPLTRVVISGGGARLGGLVNRLALATRLPVEPAAPFSRLRVGKTGLTSDQLQFAEPATVISVGLAMGVAS